MTQCYWSRLRRWMVAAILLALYGVQVWRANWTGDFWEHSAAITAMIQAPLRPQHPSMAMDAPHFFFSPYSLALACVARWVGVGSIAVLAFAGGMNLLLILYGAWRIIKRLGWAQPTRVWFYVLACWLFLWGQDAWQYSSFLHFGVLFRVLPYPSSFAIGGTLWILSVNWSQTSRWWLAGAGIVASVILLCHPLTLLLLCAGLVGFYIDGLGSSRDPFVVILIPVVALGLALCWPYFPIWHLLPGIGDAAGAYTESNFILYQGLLKRTWPVWVGAPLLFRGARFKGGQHAILVSIVLLFAVWTVGWVFRLAVLGRSIAFGLMLLQMLLAERLGVYEAVVCDAERASRTRLTAGAIILLVVLTGLGASHGLVLHQLQIWYRAPVPLHQRVEIALSDVPQHAVVLADHYTATLIPTFGFKTVAGRFPQAFIPDHAERVAAVMSVFGDESDIALLETVRERWNVTHILVNRERVQVPPAAVLSGWQKVFVENGLVLYQWTGDAT